VGEGDIGRLAGMRDVWLALRTGTVIVIVSATHPAGAANRGAAAVNNGAAAVNNGAAAARRDGEKCRAFNRLEPDGYLFTSFSVETYGRLGKPAIALLGRLGAEAAVAEGSGAVSNSAFAQSALLGLSVGLCRGNCVMYRKALGQRAGRLDQGFQPGADRPTADVP
jgi:hypothetical protein